MSRGFPAPGSFASSAIDWGIIMFAIIGIVVVFGAVVGGYLMEHGNLKVLLQPAELLIIGGAGAGDRPDRESSAHPETDCVRCGCGVQGIEVHKATLHGIPQNSLRASK